MKKYTIEIEGIKYRIEFPNEVENSFVISLCDFLKYEIDDLKKSINYNTREELFLALSIRFALYLLKIKGNIESIISDEGV